MNAYVSFFVLSITSDVYTIIYTTWHVLHKIHILLLEHMFPNMKCSTSFYKILIFISFVEVARRCINLCITFLNTIVHCLNYMLHLHFRISWSQCLFNLWRYSVCLYWRVMYPIWQIRKKSFKKLQDFTIFDLYILKTRCLLIRFNILSAYYYNFFNHVDTLVCPIFLKSI